MDIFKRPISAVAFVVLSLAGCDDFPDDISGTMESMRTSGAMRAGVVAGGNGAREAALARQIAQALNVRTSLQEGTTEALVERLEEGELDIVIGEFAKATPWSGRVALTGPARAVDPPQDHPVLRAMVRPGENRWLIFVTRVMKGDVS